MISKSKITILVDNEPGDNLKNSWGFSAYVETDKWTTLFDADTDPTVIKYNVEHLKIDLDKIDFAVLSHHHGDHYGGFEYIGSRRPGLKIFVPPGSLGYLEKWGLKPEVVYKPIKVAEDAWLTGPLKSWGLHEHAFAFHLNGKGLIVLVGCSHPGVDKLALKAREISGKDVYWVIGGYHSPSMKTLDNLANISQYISPAHCSGEQAKTYVRTRYPEKYRYVHTGSIIEL